MHTILAYLAHLQHAHRLARPPSLPSTLRVTLPCGSGVATGGGSIAWHAGCFYLPLEPKEGPEIPGCCCLWSTSSTLATMVSTVEGSLVPRPRPKNRERGLVAFPCIFCRPLALKILRSQSDCRMKPRGTSSRHMPTRPKVPTMPYGRVACDCGVVCVSYIRAGVVSRLREIGERSKSESAV